MISFKEYLEEGYKNLFTDLHTKIALGSPGKQIE